MPKIAGKLFAALVVVGILGANVARADRLIIRVTSMPPYEFIQTLSEAAELLKVSALPNEAPLALLRRVCGGSYSDAYRDLAVKNEPALKTLPQPKGTRLRLPPCLQIKRDRTVSVTNGDTLDQVLQRELGANQRTLVLLCSAPPGGVESCQTQSVGDAVRARNPATRFDQPLPAGDLKLPFTSAWTAVDPKSGATVDQAIDRLRGVAAGLTTGGDLALLKKGEELALIAPQSDDTDPAAVAALPPNWPFDVVAVKLAIKDARAFLVNSLHHAIKRATIRIVDTGADGISDPMLFPRAWLALNEREYLAACRTEFTSCIVRAGRRPRSRRLARLLRSSATPR